MDWFIADTHFSHKNILAYEADNRPYDTIEEHDADLVLKWNSVVKPDDKVYLVGDVAFSSAQHFLGQLNGKIIVVLGNHDYPNKVPNMLQFDHVKVAGAIEYKGGIITHIPVHESQLDRFTFNIHGHLHSLSIEDPRYICVSAEHNYLYPISWTVLEEHVKRLT